MVGRLLDMHSVSEKLAISSSQPQMNIHNHYPKLNIKREKGGLELSSRNISAKIDGYPCRRQFGESTVGDAIAEESEAGRESLLTFIGDSAQQGDRLGRMQPGAIAENAAERVPKLESGRKGYSYPAPPQLSWEPNYLTIHYTPDRLSFTADAVKPDIEAVPGRVDVSVAQKAYLDIEYIGSPLYVGGFAAEA